MTQQHDAPEGGKGTASGPVHNIDPAAPIWLFPEQRAIWSDGYRAGRALAPTPPAPSGLVDAEQSADPRDALVRLGIDTQVANSIMGELSGTQHKQPEWLWYDKTNGDGHGLISRGRWAKVGGQVPYVRGDIVARFAATLSGQQGGAVPAGDHLADLVSRFSAALLDKLRGAEAKYGHSDAWMRDDWQDDLCRQTAEHLAKGDPRDVAAYAAFAWHHGWSVSQAASADTLSALRRASLARQVEWAGEGTEPLPVLFKATELGGEVGEVLNVVKKLERERMGWSGSRDTVEHLADELADVLICVDLLAEPYAIDLAAAVVRKFNMTSDQRGLSTKMHRARLAEQPVPAGTGDADRVDGLRVDVADVVARFEKVDKNWGMSLTRLVDGISTFEARVDGKTREFDNTDDLYEWVGEMKRRGKERVLTDALALRAALDGASGQEEAPRGPA